MLSQEYIFTAFDILALRKQGMLLPQAPWRSAVAASFFQKTENGRSLCLVKTIYFTAFGILALRKQGMLLPQPPWRSAVAASIFQKNNGRSLCLANTIFSQHLVFKVCASSGRT